MAKSLTMNKLLFALPLLVFMACGSPEPTKVETVEQEDGTKVTQASYGEPFTAQNVMTLEQVMNQVETNGESQVILEANIVETCAKAGCWMSVENPSGEPIMVFMKDHDFFVPTEGMAGKRSFIAGTAKRDTLSVEWLQHLAEDANRPQEEIDAITEPKISISITADGVMIEGVEKASNES